MRLTIPGHGSFSPFAAESRHYGYACWANSRRFAVVAKNPSQCAVIAEIMHAYNILGNRIETFQPSSEGIALAERYRINSAVHEDDRNCFDFRKSEQCRMAIEGCSPDLAQGADRLFYLSENIAVMHRRHNDLVHEAARAQSRLQQSWNMLSEAYTVLFADIEALG